MNTIASSITTELLPLSAYGNARSTVTGTPLGAAELRKTDAYWRACNYLSLGMIYLLDNPLLTEPLRPDISRTDCLAIGGRARACRSSMCI